jgi:hypothetical protein
MMKPLTRSEFLTTFKQPMRSLDPNSPAHSPPVVRDYVSQCRREFDFLAGGVPLEVHHVYENGDRSFLHVLIFFGQRNVYLAVVVDARQEAIHGHFILDLNAEYGLDRGSDTRY